MSEDEFSDSEKPKRPDQELWDVFAEHFGQVRTKKERGRRNAAIGELLAAGATPDELRIALDFCQRNFTHYSEHAVCNWFSRSLEEHKKSGATRETFLRIVGGQQ